MAETWGIPSTLSGGILQPRVVGATLPTPDALQRGSGNSTSSSFGRNKTSTWPSNLGHSVGLSAIGLASRYLSRRSSKNILRRLRPVALRAGGAQYGDEFVGDEVDADLVDSLKQRTLEALDLDFILERLQGLCYTATAAEMAVDPHALLAQSPEEARALYDTVLELTQLEDADLDLEAKLDIADEACFVTMPLVSGMGFAAI
eukprot:s968_g19.t1